MEGVSEPGIGKQKKPVTIPAFVVTITVLTIATNLQSSAHAQEYTEPGLLNKLFVSDSEELTVIEAPDSIAYPQPATQIMAALDSPDPTIYDKNTNDFEVAPMTAGSIGALTITPLTNDTDPKRLEITTYTVQPGDTISTIAEKYGITTNTVMWANKLSSYSIIKPGETIKILPKNGVMHTVQKNETLIEIANKYKVKVEDIVKTNNMVSANQLRVGQQLIIENGVPPKPKVRHTTRLASINKIFTPKNTEKVTGDKTWLWPLPASRRITQYYHVKHKAIDVGGRPWNDLVASREGRVEYSGWSRGYGYNIVINHGNNIKTRYAHMSKLFVNVGDQVSQGETIGKVGSTGWSTGPHVHFEIMINGKKMNPLSYVQ